MKHAVIGPVGGSPNPIGCTGVCYMLRGSSLTLLHLLVESLTLPNWCHVWTFFYAPTAQIVLCVDVAWHMRARELFLFTLS